jgi:3-hydroxyisobutyrate dehydrogenase-like beta-hydroxyacid dehydrogenase
MAQQVGFIGLGTMGRPMSTNVLKKGYPLTVFDVVPSAVEWLRELGAEAAGSPRELAERSGVVITSLPNAPDVEHVYLDADGLLAGAKAGSILIEMSTIDPLTSRKLSAACKAKGVRMLDAPVAKTSDAAISGTLTIMAGGDEATYNEALPILQTMGTDIFYCGAEGTGHAMKLVNNLVSATLTMVNSEALVLGAKCGLTVETMLEVMRSSAANNGVLMNTMPRRVLGGDDTPGFMLKLGHKDLGLILQLGYLLGVSLPVTAVAREQLSQGAAEGLGDKDMSTFLKVKERQAGIRVRLKAAGGVQETSAQD